ncbi:MAG TPA: response regulator, partial [Gemmataceae bacterium]|nr:response regulator [Gemmataceae bacterium]
FGLQPHQPEPVADRPPILLRDLRVLIVDDNATNRHILEQWVRGWQMDPVAVGNGLTALDALEDAVSLNRPYPLVLLDARMPDVDGLTLAARIRERTELSATRIILLSSGDRPSDLRRARELRIAHLLKPVQQEELLGTIYRLFQKEEGGRGKAEDDNVSDLTSSALPSSVALRILVAEDNEFNARHLEQVLTRHGHRVRIATDGRETLERLRIADCRLQIEKDQSAIRNPQSAIAFDLLLLDLHMPQLDGFQVVQAIRAWEQTAGGHLPIIALTARSRKEDRERCLAVGMDDYLTKPVRPAELFAAIERLIPASRATQESREKPNRKESIPPSTTVPVVSGGGLLDPVVLLAACDEDDDALRARCQDFRVYIPARLAEVRDALQVQNATQLRQAAHKLCGLLSVFSTTAAFVASDLEDRAANGELEACRPLVEQLEAMTEELTRQLDGLSIEALRRQARATE